MVLTLLQKIGSVNPRKKGNNDSLSLVAAAPLLRRPTWERIRFDPPFLAYNDNMEGKYELHGKFKETNQISFNVGIGGLI